MTNIIIAVVLLGIIAGIVAYLVREKKKGAHCIGCPYAKECGGSKCSCHGNDNKI